MALSKLTVEQRQAIASDGRSVSDIVAEYGIGQAQVYRIKAAAIPTPNSYSVGDAVAFLKRLRRHKVPVSVVATSPPYNLGLKPRRGSDTNWKSNALAEKDGYITVGDNLPRGKYVQQQRDMLTAALALVGDDGVVCYQHKPVHRKLQVNMQQDILADFPMRQLIIWDRGSSNNHDASLFAPSYEFVAVLAGRKWKLRGEWYDASRAWNAVWRIPPGEHNEHAAPFPMELARRMVSAGNGGAVADPYAGSGTIGRAARDLGVTFYLNDISSAYAETFKESRAA